MSTRIAVRAIIMQKDTLLCVKLKAYHGIPRDDFWCLPGGGVDEGEALIPALKREMIEETGVTPEIGALLYVHQFSDGNAPNLEFFFHVTNAEDYLMVDTSQTTHGEEEIAELDFVDPKTTYILPTFLSKDDLAEKISNGPTTIVNLLDDAAVA